MKRAILKYNRLDKISWRVTSNTDEKYNQMR